MFRESESRGEQQPQPNRPYLPARLRGGANESEYAMGVCCGISVILIFAITKLYIVSCNPNEYGIMIGRWQGGLLGAPKRGGIHLRHSPWNYWYTYPATQVSIIWSDGNSYDDPDGRPISARTGHDRTPLNTTVEVSSKDEASGQPVWISCALQYKYKQDELEKLYNTLITHENAKKRFKILAKFAIVSTAQDFSPQDFWLDRQSIAEKMLEAIDKVLQKYHAEAVRFEILKVKFQHVFEDSVVQTQVEEQKITLNQFTQKVVQVIKEIDVESSENDAKIAAINAGATKVSKEMVADASQSAFSMKQNVKGNMYKQLKDKLNFDTDDLQEYIKIKSLIAKSKVGSVIVNVPEPDLGQDSEL